MKTIAIYCGTFSPFHIGHLNIIEKSEKIFGSGNVIVAIGVNLNKVKSEDLDSYIVEKENESKILSDRINRPVIFYSKFLHELVNEYEQLGYNVVLIRGLRNGADLDYEVNQMRFISDFKKDINVVYITCDKEFEHISSSAIRKIGEFGGDEMIKQYLV